MSELAPPPIGALLDGRYRLVRVLGVGGVGVVYEAEDVSRGEIVAVKVLRKELLLGGPFVERLRREAEAIKGLRHRNVVEVLDVDIKPDLAFFVMEMLEGESLGSFLRTAPPLSAGEVATIGTGILEALAIAHEAGLVHRDVKPDNVFLAKEDGATVVKLLDFGLVKQTGGAQPLTATGTVLGTFQYMPPEQAHGKPVDGRADVYSTAATLYYALTRKRPYQAADMEASMFALSDVPAPPLRELRPDLDPAFCRVVEGALVKTLDDRPTARAFIAALAPFAATSGAATMGSVAASDTKVAAAPPAMPESGEPTTERGGGPDEATASAREPAPLTPTRVPSVSAPSTDPGPPTAPRPPGTRAPPTPTADAPPPTVTATRVAGPATTAGLAPTLPSPETPRLADQTEPLREPPLKVTKAAQPEEIVAPRTMPLAPARASARPSSRPSGRARDASRSERRAGKKAARVDVRVTIFVVVALLFFGAGVLLGRAFLFR